MAQDNDTDWLDDGGAQIKAEQRAKAVEFAKQYEVFVTDPRAKAILEQWEKAFLWHTTPVDSSIQQYAADEARRNFVRQIHVQIKLAQERD